jgi:glycosyltransferase involved in cell wall biosynthesis
VVAPRNAALVYAPDAYVLPSANIMGRHAAGHAFLRAVVDYGGREKLWSYTTHAKSFHHFEQSVHALCPELECGWWSPEKPARDLKLTSLFLPGPDLAPFAAARLRQGIDHYSICGITHTTASHDAMSAITGLLASDVMPWDALICTSASVKKMVQELWRQESERLRWRFLANIDTLAPQLPVIPLGIHCRDFSFSAEQRSNARRALQLANDEVVALFVGRLSYHAKSHPHAMMSALEACAKKTGKKITLIQCGWFHNAGIANSFAQGATSTCPTIRSLILDGQQLDVRNVAWAAADMFISLADNLQETFGITPIEAMAAGLPVIVSDWDGYRESVVDGETGFRIATWMPANDLAFEFGARYELGLDSYDRYCGYTCQSVAMDADQLEQRLKQLVESPELRRKLGENGKKRANEHFDWSVIYPRYQDLWAELTAMRDAASRVPRRSPPKSSPARPDPYLAFAAYPTHAIRGETLVCARGDHGPQRFAQLRKLAFFSYANDFFAEPQRAQDYFAQLEIHRSISILDLAASLGLDERRVTFDMAVFAKMGLVTLAQAAH